MSLTCWNVVVVAVVAAVHCYEAYLTSSWTDFVAAAAAAAAVDHQSDCLLPPEILA